MPNDEYNGYANDPGDDQDHQATDALRYPFADAEQPGTGAMPVITDGAEIIDQPDEDEDEDEQVAARITASGRTTLGKYAPFLL